MDYHIKAKGNRVVNVISPGKGKKHYWGQKGKDYGYVTSEEEQTLVPYQQSAISYVPIRSKTQANNYQQQHEYKMYHEKSLWQFQDRRYSLPMKRQYNLVLQENLQKKNKSKNLSIQKNIDIVLPRINQPKKNVTIRENNPEQYGSQQPNYQQSKLKAQSFQKQQIPNAYANQNNRIKQNDNKLFSSNSKQLDNKINPKCYQYYSQRVNSIPQIQNGYSFTRKRVLRYTPTYYTSKDNPLCGIILRQQNK